VKKEILARFKRGRALIFDFDGVILESSNMREDALIHTFRENGVDKQEEIIEVHRVNQGIQRRERIRIIYETLEGSSPSEALLSVIEKGFGNYSARALLECPAVFGIEIFLKHFSDVPLFIASVAPEEEISIALENRRLSRFFKGIYGAPQKKTEIISNIIYKEGLNSDDVLFIGDRLSDFRAAEAAKVSFIGRVKLGEKNPFPRGIDNFHDFSLD